MRNFGYTSCNSGHVQTRSRTLPFYLCGAFYCCSLSLPKKLYWESFEKPFLCIIIKC